MHRDLVRGVWVPSKHRLFRLAFSATFCVEFGEVDVFNQGYSAISAERLNLVDRSRRLFGNMEIFTTNIVGEEHKSHLVRTETIVSIGAVKSLCLAIDVRVVELDLNLVCVLSSLQADTLDSVNTSEIMSSHL